MQTLNPGVNFYLLRLKKKDEKFRALERPLGCDPEFQMRVKFIHWAIGSVLAPMELGFEQIFLQKCRLKGHLASWWWQKMSEIRKTSSNIRETKNGNISNANVFKSKITKLASTENSTSFHNYAN